MKIYSKKIHFALFLTTFFFFSCRVQKDMSKSIEVLKSLEGEYEAIPFNDTLFSNKTKNFAFSKFMRKPNEDLENSISETRTYKFEIKHTKKLKICVSCKVDEKIIFVKTYRLKPQSSNIFLLKK